MRSSSFFDSPSFWNGGAPIVTGIEVTPSGISIRSMSRVRKVALTPPRAWKSAIATAHHCHGTYVRSRTKSSNPLPDRTSGAGVVATGGAGASGADAPRTSMVPMRTCTTRSRADSDVPSGEAGRATIGSGAMASERREGRTATGDSTR